MAVGGLMARAGICCAVERKLLPSLQAVKSMLNLILRLGYNDFKSNGGRLSSS